MAYIGKTPTIGNFQICDAITVVDAQAAYTMQVSSVDVFPETANHMLVSLNGILQAPTTSFTVSGSTLTFASNLITGDVIDFVMILGNVLDLGVPSDNTVTTAKLADSSVTTAKLNDASVSLAKLTATGTKDATTFLRGDNTFATVVSGLSMADQWRITANHTTSGTITSNWERVDNTGWGGIGTGMTESSGVFTFPSTGVYSIRFTCQGNGVDNDNINGYIQVTVNNADYNDVARANWSTTNGEFNGSSTEFLFDVTNVTTHKARMKGDSIDAGSAIVGSTSESQTFVTFVRLGDT
jgi:hypothetical protein